MFSITHSEAQAAFTSLASFLRASSELIILLLLAMFTTWGLLMTACIFHSFHSLTRVELGLHIDHEGDGSATIECVRHSDYYDKALEYIAWFIKLLVYGVEEEEEEDESWFVVQDEFAF
jgi:hypothetical protein